MAIDLGFKVKKSDANKPERHNGTIQPDVYTKLLNRSVELSTPENRNEITAQVFGEFWRQWKSL